MSNLASAPVQALQVGEAAVLEAVVPQGLVVVAVAWEQVAVVVAVLVPVVVALVAVGDGEAWE